MSWPEVPFDVTEHGLSDEELAELWHALIVELLNTELSGRTHHNRRTYDAGCRGPLCSKSTREYARRRNATAPNEKYRYIDPILDYWYPVAMQRIHNARESILRELTAS